MEAKSKRASVESSSSSAAAVAAAARGQQFSLQGSSSTSTSHAAYEHDDHHRSHHDHLEGSASDLVSAASRESSARSLSSSFSSEGQQRRQQQQQAQRRRSTTSSSGFSSIASELPEDTALAKHDFATGAVAAELEQQEEIMAVEEVDVEDFCLEEELDDYAATSTATGTAVGDSRSSCARTYGKMGISQAHGRRESGGSGGRAITESEALGVRELLFGDCSKMFNEAWREQGFYFCEGVDGLGYGLIQAEGGPCGVLAAVQAFLLEVFGLPPQLESCL